MATITKRKRAGGSRYTAQIRTMRNGRIIHTESQTFDKRGQAEAWAIMREDALKKPGALHGAQIGKLTVGDLIKRYIDEFQDFGNFGRSKLSHLTYMREGLDLGRRQVATLTSADLVAHVRKRRLSGVTGATVNNDLIWLRVVFKVAKAAWGIPVDVQTVDDAAILCRAEKLITRATQRERRPTLDELDALMSYFSEQDGRATIPMVDVVPFAIFSSRRQDEICRIAFQDVDSEEHSVIVRDMKHPGQKMGNDVSCYLTDEAWSVYERLPKIGPLLFPYKPRSIGGAFAKACKFLQIEDLHFHDLRHESVSWLFEMGWDIPRVASVSGHRSWQSLNRYTHLSKKQPFNKFKNWKWLNYRA